MGLGLAKVEVIALFLRRVIQVVLHKEDVMAASHQFPLVKKISLCVYHLETSIWVPHLYTIRNL